MVSPYVTGTYNKICRSEEDAIFTSNSKRVSKKERVFKITRQFQHPEIIRKDMILMNKVFKRVYGETYKNFAESNFMKVNPDIEHFNLYYGDEADSFETSEGLLIFLLSVLLIPPSISFDDEVLCMYNGIYIIYNLYF